MDHDTAVRLKEIAARVASRLMTALEYGAIPRIGIDEVRAALSTEPEFPASRAAREHLEKFTLRRIVESVR